MNRQCLLLILILIVIWAQVSNAVVLFIDTNKGHYTKDPNVMTEYRACYEGASMNENDGAIYVSIADPGKKKGPKELVKERIQKAYDDGLQIDSIVFTGEHVSGTIFGKLGTFRNQFLEELFLDDDIPEIRRDVTSMGFSGCYPTTDYAAQKLWFMNIPNSNIKMEMGFMLRGPRFDRTEGHDLLREFCRRRKDGAEKANGGDELCKFYDEVLAVAPTTSVGMCSRTRIAATAYAARARDPHCFSYQDLEDRCRDFLRSNWWNEFGEYMTGEKEPQIESEDASVVTGPRDLYNQASLWRHCVDKEASGENIYPTPQADRLPDASTMLRLVKWHKVRKNISHIHESELANFDQVLERVGRSDLAIGDIGNPELTRKEIVNKIEKAVSYFETKSGAKNQRILRMAQCMRETFVYLSPGCVPTESVIDGSTEKRSRCLRTFEKTTLERGKNDPC